MSDFLRRQMRGSLGKIYAANAADGVGLSVNDSKSARQILDAMARDASGYLARNPAAGDDAAFRAVLKDTCHGEMKKAGGYPSKFLAQNPAKPNAIRAKWVSTVVGGAFFRTLVDDKDWDRVFAPLGGQLGEIDLGSIEENQLASLDPDIRTLRHFKLGMNKINPKVENQIGNSVLWFTQRPRFEKLLKMGIAPGKSRADLVTDMLGLFESFTPQGLGGVLNHNQHKFALHIPRAVAQRAMCFRPTIIEAADYPRFMVQSRNRRKRPNASWGQTLDLSALALEGELRDGMPELVSWPVRASHFRAGEVIQYDYLGAVTCAKGCVPRFDTDDAVAEKLAAKRTGVEMLKKMWR
jgi:hypothetical protein